MPEHDTRNRWLLPLILGVVHLLMFWFYVGNRSSGTDSAWTGFPLDDTWIHLVYARSFAEGGGFAYNPGQWEAGFTSPLWVIAMAPLFWITGFNDVAVVVAVKLLGTLLSFAGCLLAFKIGTRLAGQVAGWTFAFMLALDPALGFARVSGMEIPLAFAASLWVLYALVERRPVMAGLGLACCGLARPELGLFAVLAVPPLLLLLRGKEWRVKLAALLPAPLGALSWVVHNLWATGRPLPSTFYAKSEFLSSGGVPAGSDLSVVGRMLVDLPWFSWGIGLPLLVLGSLLLVRMRRPEALPVLGTSLLLPLAIAFGTSLLEPGAFYWHRYFMPVIPFLYLIVALAGGEAWRLRRRSRTSFAGAVVVAVLFLAGTAFLPVKLVASSNLYSWNTQNINEVQVTLGKWVAENLPRHESIAVNDAGAIRYFGGLHTVDLVGLNSHEVQQVGMQTVLMRYKPRFYVLFPSWYPGIEADPTMRPIHSTTSPRYTICNCDQATMVVFERRYTE